MITQPLSPAEFLEQFKRGQIGNDKNGILINDQTVEGGELIVYFSIVETYWPYEFVFKSHHVHPTRSVTVQGRVTKVMDGEFTCEILHNNGFAKSEKVEGKTFTFHKGYLLCEQDYKHPEKLGVWSCSKEEIPEKCPWGDTGHDRKPKHAEAENPG